jgi:hypothetical protein
MVPQFHDRAVVQPDVELFGQCSVPIQFDVVTALLGIEGVLPQSQRSAVAGFDVFGVPRATSFLLEHIHRDPTEP